MKSIKVVDGDMAVGGDGNIVLIEGAERIKQDISLRLLEPIGTDPVYPKFGSQLWDYIGSLATDDNDLLIRAEIYRIIENYIEEQNAQMAVHKQTYSSEQFLSMWSDDDVISSIGNIGITRENNTVNVHISLNLVSGASVNVSESL